jgi:SAM-dependent methyltransferase
VSITDDRIRDILADTQLDGRHLRITQRLDRDEYLAVNKVLTNLGGTWSRGAKAHVFDHDPSEALREVIAGGQLPGEPAKTEGYVATPPELAKHLVACHLDELPHAAAVLDPSAGTGALVRAVAEAHPDAAVTAVEPNEHRAAAITGLDTVAVRVTTFEDYATEAAAGGFDAVVMNPPFSVPADRTCWIEHVRLAWRMLAPGGRLVAIAPAGYVFREDRRHRAVRGLIEAHGGHAELPDDAFHGSGTGVRTVVLCADKPSRPAGEPAELADLAPRHRARRGDPDKRAARQTADRELRESATALLEDPDRVAAMNRALAGCSARIQGYSERNRALLYLQALERELPLSDVATYVQWRQRGRQVRKGERGLRIVAYQGDEDSDSRVEADEYEPSGAEEQSESTENSEQDSPRFRMVARFDHSQTDEVTTEDDRVAGQGGSETGLGAGRAVAETPNARLAGTEAGRP